MRWGLIARCETDRGLGIQSLAMYQNLHPDKTLVVDVPQSGFACHIENYPDAWKVTYNEGLSDQQDVVRDWWSDLDVVVSVETLYGVEAWAKADGVHTIIQGNPEFVKPNGEGWPDTWWWPTTWRLDKLPPGRLLEVPVPDNAPIRRATEDQCIKFVHIAGNRAMADRNGSLIVKAALRGLDKRAFVNSYCQKDGFDLHRDHQRAIELPSVEDRWTMYNGATALVLPRRFGGLCLPALEAFASGVPVMMPDCSPNLDWPIWPLPSDASKVLQTPAGDVQTFDVLSNDLRTAMNTVAASPKLLEPYHERMQEWVDHNCWGSRAPVYYDAIETASRR